MISIYNVNNTDYTKNGNAVLIPDECKLSVQINGSWTLSLTHPYDEEERYKLIVKDAVIKVTDINCISENVGTGKNQLFRIYNVTKNDKTGVSATAFPIAMECMYDVPIDSVNIVDNGAVLAMEALQNFTNKYTLFCDNFGDRHTAQWGNTNLAAVLNGDKDSFVKIYGGEIIYNNYKIEVWEHIGNWLQTGVHPVYYGRNILGIDYSVDESGVLTRLFPISSDGIKLNGLGYIDSAKINQYPFIRANFVSAPYNLVDTSEGSDSNTAILTRSIQTQIQTLASTLSHSIFNSITADRSYEREYIKSVRTEIINAVTTNCLSSVSHEKLYSVMSKAINEGMAWMKDIQKSDWSWHENQTGWWYGADGNDYAKNQWCYIDRKWRWFNAEGYWVEKWDDSGDWDWVQSKDNSHWWYGNNKKYYAHDEWVYETVSGELKYYWLNEEGWYESDYTGVSGWTWHAWGDGWWFGEEGASLDDTSKFAHDQWIWIDGTYYFFDSTGYNAPDAKIENYAWDWQEDNQWYWFGNTDKSYGANYLKSQWQKIDGDWWKFDSNGYRLEQSTILSGVNSTFVTGMASLKTLCESLKNDAYTLLYSNMTSYCQKRFTDGLDSPNVTININMIDLAKTQEYSKYSVYEKLCLGDNIECIDYEHGISVEERIVGLTYDCLEQYNTAITVGKLEGSIADRIGAGGNAEGNVSGGFDTSIMESRIQQNAEGIAALQSGKQDKLTAGQNITIDGNVISATGGGQGLEYWEETSQRFYRDYKVDGISADEGFKKTEWIQEHYSSYTTGEGLLYRKKGTAPVIAGEVGDSTLQSDCRRIVMASTNAEDLDWEWAHCNPASAHLTPTSDWFDKEDYPLVPSQYPAYDFGWQTATITYNGVTWYIMAIQPMYGDGYNHLTNGNLSVKHTTSMRSMTCAQLGQFLLEQIHASDKVDAQVSIGVNGNVFQWVVDGEEVAWINADGTSSFDREEINEVVPLTQEEYDDLPSSKLTDNKAYFVKQSQTLDPNYEYHEYEGARGGKIIARVNLASNEIDWFFVDYTFVGGVVEYLPNTLSAYFPTSTISGEAYDDEGEFVGMAVINNRGGFGLYPRDYSREIAGTVRCLLHNVGGTDQVNAYEEPYVWISNDSYKIIVNGENYLQASGGTEVEANPSGTATDTLNTIGIDGTIYSLPSGGGGGEQVTNIIGASSDWGKYQESDMNITWQAGNQINFAWNGGGSVGGDIVKIVQIPASANKIRFKMTTGTSYSTTLERMKLGIGVRTTYSTSLVMDDYNTTDWLSFKHFTENNSVWEDELDLSSVTVDTYLYILGHGWNVNVTQLDLVEIESNEKVKGLTQAEYDALPSSKNSDGVAYFVDDSGTYKIMFNGHNYSGT